MKERPRENVAPSVRKNPSVTLTPPMRSGEPVLSAMVKKPIQP